MFDVDLTVSITFSLNRPQNSKKIVTKSECVLTDKTKSGAYYTYSESIKIKGKNLVL